VIVAAPIGFRQQIRRFGWALGLAALALLAVVTAPVTARAATRTISYRGYVLRVPVSWPVYRLNGGSTVCVRFNRHALYLGQPGADQRCPANQIGRTEAILVTPPTSSTHAAAAFSSAAPLSESTRAGAQGGEAELKLARGGLSVTATWSRDPGLIKRALHLRSLHAARAPAASSPGAQPTFHSMAAQARAAAVSNGTTYTGRGFDACSTPSESTMSAWSSSPYRAIGIYIGGANMACSQPNLSTAWMQAEWAAGWHMFPIYVGLQAPGNSCGCAAFSLSTASSDGAAAANDAVAHAQAVGISPGNPIYDDMEGYSRGGSRTTAVLDFLQAWTTTLHADGYASGVYSSGESGITDLSNQYGTSYPEPDDIWVADWNGQRSTNDPYLPSADWTDHQRLHQYDGGQNVRYGGVTINIDGDYLDAGTVFGGGSVVPAAPFPALKVSPTSNGIVKLTANWQGTIGITSWRTLGGSSASSLAAVDQTNGGPITTISEKSVFPYYEVQAIGSTGQVLGTSQAVATRPHIAIYGRSAYAPATTNGPTGLPMGCFTGHACHISLTVKAGRRTVATTGPERLATSGGIVFFKLTSAGRALLASAPGRRLAVKVNARDISSGRSANARLNIVPYTTVGKGPGHSSGSSPTLHFVGLRDYVYRDSSGGVLAGCRGSIPCVVSTKIVAGHQTIATTGHQTIGANEAAYLNYRFTAYGRSLMGAAKGNQLGALVILTSSTGQTLHGHLVLSSFR
jgi:hypothetical protein